MIRRRRRSALTDYSKRVELLKGGMPRVVVRKSNRGISIQIIGYEQRGDRVLASANSKELAKMDWPSRSNIPTAYLTGLLLARKAKSIESNLVLDIGLYKPAKSTVVFAAAKGVVDGGLKLVNSIEFDPKRLSGQHIADYAKSLKSNDAAYKKQFSGYIEGKIDAERLAELFESAKKKIMNA